MQPLAWSVVILLALSVVVLVRHVRRRATAHGRAIAEMSVENARRLAELATSEAGRRSEVRRALERDAAAHAEEAAAKIRLLTAQRQEALRALAGTWGSEVVSHRMIADACAAAGLDGVLASDVVFVPVETVPGRRHFAQVDHVLLTRHGALIIEAKHWRGLVLDGVTPDTVHPAIAALVPDHPTTPPFALQITRGQCRCTAGSEAIETLVVRRHVDGDAPVAQVRRQAGRLVEHLERRTGHRLWLQTHVLYSHPDALVVAAPEHRLSARVFTRVLVGHAQLVEAFAGVARGPASRLTEDLIARMTHELAAAGAHIEVVGPRAAHGSGTENEPRAENHSQASGAGREEPRTS